MSLLDVIAIIPTKGQTTWGKKGSIEDTIDRAFELLIREAPTAREQGFVQGLYCAYVYMTLNETNWADIKEFLESATGYGRA